MHRAEVSIVIPAFNEEKSIAGVIEETIAVMNSIQIPYEIIISDDGSTDRTGQIASTYKVTVVHNDRNRGKGHAMRKAFKEASGNIIVCLDADGSHKPKEISNLVSPLLHGYDIVPGSRFLGTDKNWTTRVNMLGNRMFNATIFMLTGKLVTDSQTGFRALKKEVLDSLNLESDGYEVESEITVKGLRNGFTFQEKPMSCQGRRHNASKLHILADGTRILKTIIRSSISKIEHT